MLGRTYVYTLALQCVAVCCSVLQCVAVCCSVLQSPKRTSRMDIHMQGSSLNINVKKITEAHLYYNVSVCFSVFQWVQVCCSVLQCIAVCCSVLQCAAVCCSVLQCVTVCCNESPKHICIQIYPDLVRMGSGPSQIKCCHPDLVRMGSWPLLIKGSRIAEAHLYSDSDSFALVQDYVAT